jgi:hypothetical protein
MSAFHVRDILSVPGKLYLNPTDLTNPGANTPTLCLGVVQEVSVLVDKSYFWVTAEEYGGERVEGHIAKEGCAVGFILRSWDRDMMAQLFPNTAAGSVTGKRRVVSPGSIRAGEPLSNRSCVLAFCPDDYDNHPVFLMRRALPALKETAEVAMSLDTEFNLPAIFYGIRDTSNRLYDWGLGRDLQVLL